MENKEGAFPLDTRLATPDYKWSFSIWNADNVVMHKTGGQATVIQTMAIAKEVVPAEDLLALGIYGFDSLIREGKERASILVTALLSGFKDVLILRRFIFSNMSCLLYFCDTLPTMKECIQASLKSADYSAFCKRTIIPLVLVALA